MVDRINQLSQIFRASKFPLIFVQHDGTSFDEFVPNTIEWELLETLKVIPDDILVNKYANDVFYKPDLQKILNDLQIEELIITGCATDFCVVSAIQSALTREYHVVVVEDSYTAGERPRFKAGKVIEYYNWV